jgi:hypothetical protein
VLAGIFLTETPKLVAGLPRLDSPKLAHQVEHILLRQLTIKLPLQAGGLKRTHRRGRRMVGHDANGFVGATLRTSNAAAAALRQLNQEDFVNV